MYYFDFILDVFSFFIYANSPAAVAKSYIVCLTWAA